MKEGLTENRVLSPSLGVSHGEAQSLERAGPALGPTGDAAHLRPRPERRPVRGHCRGVEACLPLSPVAVMCEPHSTEEGPPDSPGGRRRGRIQQRGFSQTEAGTDVAGPAVAECEAELVPRLWGLAGPGRRCGRQAPGCPRLFQPRLRRVPQRAARMRVRVASGWLTDAGPGADAWIQYRALPQALAGLTKQSPQSGAHGCHRSPEPTGC